MPNISTPIGQLALAPTGRVLFLSRHPVMLGVRVTSCILLRRYASLQVDCCFNHQVSRRVARLEWYLTVHRVGIYLL